MNLIRLLRQVENIASMMQKREGDGLFILKERPGAALDDFISWHQLKRDAENERRYLETRKAQSNDG